MGFYERKCESLIEHCQTYPKLQMQDVFKFLYQSAFGCEHLQMSPEAITGHIQKEYASLSHHHPAAVEKLDGGYCRVPLSCMDQGLQAHTLGKLFCLSARKEENGMEMLLQKLSIAKDLICQNQLPFSLDEFEKALKEWKEKGYPPIHHSESFRQNYHPAYRVIAKEYVPLLPLLSEIDNRIRMDTGAETDRIILAIEGGSASGKTTLSGLLSELYGCTVFHMDDFFLQPNQRTAVRLAEAGGNIDRERFLAEVLIPLSEGQTINYRRFDCSTQTLSAPIQIVPTRLTVIEGVYSMHPEFSGYINLSVYLEISSALQKKRILHRNAPETAKRFFDQWIPLETIYFEQMKVKERCNIILPHRA